MNVKVPNLELIIEALVPDLRIDAAYLMGSAVRGALRHDSDLDIALLPSKGYRFDDLERCALATELYSIAGREVDIGIISSKNLVYAKEALLTGMRIFARNQASIDETVANLLGMYVFFNEERSEVLRAYRV